MRGVAYQQEYSTNSSSSGQDGGHYKDPLADVDGCKRDIPILEELRTNTIRVYAIDPKADHTECMSMLQDAGIYVVAYLSQPDASIIRNSPSWDDELYARYAEVIDAMVGCGGPTHDRARAALGRLSTLADEAAGALRSGAVDTWAEVLTACTEGQRALHPALVGRAHTAAIEVAQHERAIGWKVNGAGGDGGSLTVVAADRDAAVGLAGALSRVDPSWQVVALARVTASEYGRPAPGYAQAVDLLKV